MSARLKGHALILCIPGTIRPGCRCGWLGDFWTNKRREFERHKAEVRVAMRKEIEERSASELQSRRKREQKRKAKHDRRARLRGAPGIYTLAQLQARKDYWGNRCWMCGGRADTIDHVIPLADGGTNWPSNLRPACARCNSSKGVKRVVA